MPTCKSKSDFTGSPFIFIHVPKTAGVSVSELLEPHSEPYENDLALRNHILRTEPDLLGRYQGILFWHITARSLRTFYPSDHFRNAHSFGFIRNPWDWLVSMYAFIRGADGHPEQMITRHMTFEDFLRYWKTKNVQQWDFLGNGNELLVDAVYMFEKLDEELQTLSTKISTPLTAASRLNTSSHDPYQSYYTAETARWVTEVCAKDIEFGRYRFEA